MKIMMILTELSPGGAERVVLDLTGELIDAGHSVLVVSLKELPSPERSAIADALKACGAQLVSFGITRHSLPPVFRLRKLILKERPDLVHAHLLHPNLLSRMTRLFLRFPLLNTVHIAEKRRSQNLLLKLDHWTFFLCDCCNAVSEAAARFHEKRCQLPSGSIRVIWNGSDPVPVPSAEKAAQMKREWGVEHCSKILGAVGRLDRQKGFDRLLELLPAFAEKVPQGEKYALVFIGDGAERAALEQQKKSLDELDLPFKIVFAGYRKDAAELMNLFDLFIMPSRYEGYGLTLTEALSSGIPVFCSNADSLPELCGKVPEHTLVSDFYSETPEQLAADFAKALKLTRFPGIVLQSRKEMTRQYLELYGEILRRK